MEYWSRCHTIFEDVFHFQQISKTHSSVPLWANSGVDNQIIFKGKPNSFEHGSVILEGRSVILEGGSVILEGGSVILECFSKFRVFQCFTLINATSNWPTMTNHPKWLTFHPKSLTHLSKWLNNSPNCLFSKLFTHLTT